MHGPKLLNKLTFKINLLVKNNKKQFGLSSAFFPQFYGDHCKLSNYRQKIWNYLTEYKRGVCMYLVKNCP